MPLLRTCAVHFSSRCAACSFFGQKYVVKGHCVTFIICLVEATPLGCNSAITVKQWRCIQNMFSFQSFGVKYLLLLDKRYKACCCTCCPVLAWLTWNSTETLSLDVHARDFVLGMSVLLDSPPMFSPVISRVLLWPLEKHDIRWDPGNSCRRYFLQELSGSIKGKIYSTKTTREYGKILAGISSKHLTFFHYRTAKRYCDLPHHRTIPLKELSVTDIMGPVIENIKGTETSGVVSSSSGCNSCKNKVGGTSKESSTRSCAGRFGLRFSSRALILWVYDSWLSDLIC